MDYPEPIACARAIVGTQLKLNRDDGRPKFFAIYDLGGGTVDFAFGMFRTALDEDEEEESDYFIENFGTDGDEKVGGEKLIHQLAYKIYCDNRDVMVENRIKFVLPEGKLRPEGFGTLVSEHGDDIADSNVHALKENLARALFRYDGSNGEIADQLEEMFRGETDEEAKFIETDADGDAVIQFPSLRNANGEDVHELQLKVGGIGKDDSRHGADVQADAGA